MSKILIFSDIHIHDHKNSINRLYDCLDVLDWVYSTAYHLNIENVLFLGDLFQDRQKIQTIVYKLTYDILLKWSPHVNLYLLLGNHDMWYSDKWDINSIAPFGSLQNTFILDKPTTLQIDNLMVDFLPYSKNPIPIIKELLSKHSHGRILCGHIALDGAKLNKIQTADVSVEQDGDMVKVDAQLFQTYDKVFLGHYHMAQKCSHNIEYVGSPLQLNFGEAHQDKHIVVLDTETLETKYIPNDFSPKHFIIDKEDLSAIDVKNNFIRINPHNIKTTEALDIKKSILSEGALTIEFQSCQNKETLDKDINIIKNIFTSNQSDIIDKFVENSEIKTLNKNTLIEVGKRIWQDSGSK